MKHALKKLFHPVVRKIESDFQTFKKRNSAWIGRMPPFAPDAQQALIVGLHDFIPSVKTEGFLAKALAEKRMRPAVLLYRHQFQAREYYKLFGIVDFYLFDDFSRERSDEIEEVLHSFLHKPLSVSEVLRFEYRGVLVGRHALSLVVRQMHSGGLDFTNQTFVMKIRSTLRDALLAVHAAEACFDHVKPALVLFNERGYVPFGELFDVSLKRGINTIQYVGTHLDEALHFKRYTYDMRTHHPVSLHPTTWKTILETPLSDPEMESFIDEHYQNYKSGQWFSRQRLQSGKTITAADATRRHLQLDSAKKTAVIFSHVLWDATFFYGEGLFEDYSEWLVQTVKAACSNPNVNWVVKLHPANVWRLALDHFKGELAEYRLLRERVGPLPPHVKLLDPTSELNTFSLFQVTDYCITVRGTIGMEMPIFGIPVITAGTGRYSEYGFTINSDSPEEYLERLKNIQDIPRMSAEKIALARRHAYAIFKKRPLHFRSFRMVYSQDSHTPSYLNPAVEAGVTAASDFKTAMDLAAFADWAIDPSSMDYLDWTTR